MNSAPPAARVLREAAAAVPGRLLLWRGPTGGGSDVDLLALPGACDGLERVLQARGLSPREEGGGRTIWRGCDFPIDVLSWQSWPEWNPSLAGIVERAEMTDEGILGASAEDICLILAAESVVGLPLRALVPKLRGALVHADRTVLRRVAANEGARGLAVIAERPNVLLGCAVRGRLPYVRAVMVAMLCRRARPAIRHRVRARFGRRVRAGARRRGSLLIALSGMDGSGKSSAASVMSEALAGRGVDVKVSWWRLAEESRLLDGIALPVKRLLGWTGTVADVVAAGGPRGGNAVEPGPPRTALRNAVAWAWTPIIAVLSARSFRAKASAAPEGGALVLDRWRADALVDLEVRYGRHFAARALLRAFVPRPDAGIWLRVDSQTAAARKPGDQDPGVLGRMGLLYARVAAAERLVPVDASAPLEQVAADLREIAATLVPAADALG